MCELHNLRIELARKCKRLGLCDTFGTFDNGAYVKVAETLTDYRYTIVIENIVQPYFFTEKITNAFLAQCVPVYLGAEKIDKFFNPDGIIKLKSDDDIEKVLKQCTKEEYERRLPAIIENYNKVKDNYLAIGDTMFLKYLK